MRIKKSQLFFLVTGCAVAGFVFFNPPFSPSHPAGSFFPEPSALLTRLFSGDFYEEDNEKPSEAPPPAESSGILKMSDEGSAFVLSKNATISFTDLKEQLDGAAVSYSALDASVITSAPSYIKVTSRPFKAQNENNSRSFTCISGCDPAAEEKAKASTINWHALLPKITTSLAAGDVHNDGWDDFLVFGDHFISPALVSFTNFDSHGFEYENIPAPDATVFAGLTDLNPGDEWENALFLTNRVITPQLKLYSNLGGQAFEAQKIPLAEEILVAALVDLNGDGWLDIVYSQTSGKNFVLYNDHGNFILPNKRPLGPPVKGGMTTSFSFADVNKDGVLEVFAVNSGAPSTLLTRKGLIFEQTPDTSTFSPAEMGPDFKVVLERDISYTGWTWNRKFADLDNDGWQDVYIARGNINYLPDGTSLFYRNIDGQRFADLTKEYGLKDFTPKPSSSFFDYDHDGDLDIVAAALDGPPVIFRNNAGAAQSSTEIALQDLSSLNSQALGAKITIRYAEKMQMQMINGSGPSQSFDPALVHFGLGAVKVIQTIEIEWPDGKKDVLNGAFPAGARYRITRS